MELKKHEKLYSTENLVGYVRFSGGALEVHENYIVCYKNFLPFSWNVYGRTSIIIELSNIDLLEYRGCGWFPGHFAICFRHYQRPIKFFFGKWFVWRRKKFNKEMQPLYEFIASKVMVGWEKDRIRKTQSFDELKKIGLCPVCGAKIEEDTSFCDCCGAKVK